MIERTFQDVPEGKVGEADQQSFLVSIGWSSATTWKDLLRSKRVLMISEAGAGKTHECRQQAQLLLDGGEFSFFVDLAALGAENLRDMLDPDEEIRLDKWLSSQSEIATFFLDSIDELILSLRSFEQALKRFRRGIDNQLGRARIVITTRPIPFDELLARQLLPIPAAPSVDSSDETFAMIAMGDHQTRQVSDTDDDAAPDWRTVALMPLSDAQIAQVATIQGVENPGELLSDLEKRNAQEFARRPQDLIELCADWRLHKRIRSHRDQVAANVRVKLQPREDRAEPAELSVDRATEGASRLALAMLVTRFTTIRHSAASDDIRDEAALNPATILSDWNPDEIRALLERPLFGFASYGRVRFHHRSVLEYLAAERLHTLRERGMSLRALKRLIFAQTKGKPIVRPSRRPIAGWLALAEDGIFEMLRDHEPAVLLDEGDPESLSPTQRNQALSAFVKRYGQGGWRGLSVPRIQIHRFASAELADILTELWEKGIENPDVREILLHLIAAGPIAACTDISHEAALDGEASLVERVFGVDALAATRDPRLKDIVSRLVAGDTIWPNKISQEVLLRLFPRDISIDQLCQSLSWMNVGRRSAGGLSWQLPRLIANGKPTPTDLAALRDGLVELLSAGLRWNQGWPHIVCDRPHLSGALAATCVHGLDGTKTDSWLYAAVLAHRLHDRHHASDEAHKALGERLANLSAKDTAGLFWAEDSLIQSVHPIAGPWQRLVQITLHDGPVSLRAERDLGWIKKALSDPGRSELDRALLLEAAMLLSPSLKRRKDHLLGLKSLVADQPDLISEIDERLKPSKDIQVHERWKRTEDKRKRQQDRRDAKTKAKLMQFSREVSNDPETAFSPERRSKTMWTLWEVMSRVGEEGRASGWNRQFIEEQFGEETADRLRWALMTTWREDHPSLASERPEGERHTFLVRWQVGLAGIYAEAEDPSWATNLTDTEAKLAARYAPVEHGGLPIWMPSLVDAHASAVDAILGNELSWELKRLKDAPGHSMLLQNLSYASESVAELFLPRLREWLDTDGDAVDAVSDLAAIAERIRQVMGVMLRHGGKNMHVYVRTVARQRIQEDLPEALFSVWLSTLMQVDPGPGVSALEDRLRNVEPEALSEGVKWFSAIFGDRQNEINLKAPEFTPQVLLCLLRLAYHHVRTIDDAQREGTYSPDMRDHAEHARHAIVNALLDAKGEDGWAAKLQMAQDPLCSHFRDRILAVAEENWAHEVDSVACHEDQAVALDRTGEAPPSTNEGMFDLMSDRLADLNDLLLSDTSPRDAWAGITDEKILRREIARQLNYAARGLYKVDQEAVTAEENRTDIRLRSPVSDHEAVVELKRADNRSARDLRDTICGQLVTRYLTIETRRSGCLLVLSAKDRKWKHPDNGKLIGLTELESLLRHETTRVEEEMGGMVRLGVHFLDLRPPKPIEKRGNRARDTL